MKLHHKLIPVMALAIVAVLVVSCSPAPDNGTVELPYDDEIVTFVYGETQTQYSIAQLRAMESITQEIIRKDDAGDITSQYSVKGVTLETVLDDLGIELADVQSLRLVAGDGYAVEIPGRIAANRLFIFAYEMDGAPLQQGTAPLRAFIPEEETMYWVRNLETIYILKADSTDRTSSVEKIVFFETLLLGLDPAEYADEENALAVTSAEVMAGVNASNTVYLLAQDNFYKHEEHETFIGAYIVVQGENTPAFRSPDLPRGMHVRNLLWFSSGDTGFLVVERALDYFDSMEVDGNTGINLLEVVLYFGLQQADSYILEAADGFSVEIAHEDLDKGIVHIREDSGQVATRFDGLPRNTSIRDLMSLRPADQE